MAPTILVVDDDPVTHLVVQRYLERSGYRMLSAKNGLEALDRATHDLPQVILMDVRMAEMDGLRALQQLKEFEATRAIPVIMLTVHADRATQLESEVAGAAAFLTKPFSPAQLLAEIQKLAPLPAAATDVPQTKA